MPQIINPNLANNQIRTQRIVLLATPSEKDVLKDYAESHGMSMGEVLRKALARDVGNAWRPTGTADRVASVLLAICEHQMACPGQGVPEDILKEANVALRLFNNPA